jgi:hypothetical protein
MCCLYAVGKKNKSWHSDVLSFKKKKSNDTTILFADEDVIKNRFLEFSLFTPLPTLSAPSPTSSLHFRHPSFPLISPRLASLSVIGDGDRDKQ